MCYGSTKQLMQWIFSSNSIKDQHARGKIRKQII